MYCRKFLALFLTLLFSQNAVSYRILAIVSVPLRSHYMAFHSLFKELAHRGHSVTVINNYSDKQPIANLQFVDISNNKTNFAGYFTPLEFYETSDSTYLHLYNFYRHFAITPDASRTDCENLFTHENARAHLVEGAYYDVIFAEQFVGDCGLAYVAALFDAPIIGITSHVLLPLSYSRLGLPFDVSADQFYFSKGGPNPTLYYKVEAFILHHFYNTIGRWYNQRPVYEMFHRYLPEFNLDIEKVAQERIKMVFAYQHFSLTGSRVLSPNVLEIGGIHIGKPKATPDNIEKFLADAESGAIYVSFGSNLKANTMTAAKTQQFLDAFTNIPQKVIWKYENATFHANPQVLAESWFPQLDILCHPKVLGFVMHGGMLSLSESTYCGKPVLVIPFFGDQFSNAAAAEAIGLGKILYFDKLNSSNLAEGIREITTRKMQRNAKKISAMWHDRPMNVMDSAIYWTEYVARHGSAPPSLPSQRSTWFERTLIDVNTVLICLFLIISYLIFKLMVVIYYGLELFLDTIVNMMLGKGKSKEE